MSDWLSEPIYPSISTEPWLSPIEGQLSVDVIETEKNVIIRSAIAGVKAEGELGTRLEKLRALIKEREDALRAG